MTQREEDKDGFIALSLLLGETLTTMRGLGSKVDQLTADVKHMSDQITQVSNKVDQVAIGLQNDVQNLAKRLDVMEAWKEHADRAAQSRIVERKRIEVGLIAAVTILAVMVLWLGMVVLR